MVNLKYPIRRLATPLAQAPVLVCFMCLTVLGGCKVGPNFSRPDVAQNADYSREKLPSTTASAGDVAGGAAQRLVAGMDIPGQWWTLFRSPTLNALVEEALRANADVAAAQAALRQANELVFADQASLFPSLSGSASKTREKVSAVTLGSAGSGSTSIPILTVNSASLSVSYAPDVFGGVRRQIESTSAQAEYERYQLEATYLTLSSNVVNTAVTLASLRDQVTATEQIIQLQSDQLDLLKSRRELGAIADTDVLTQEASSGANPRHLAAAAKATRANAQPIDGLSGAFSEPGQG